MTVRTKRAPSFAILKPANNVVTINDLTNAVSVAQGEPADPDEVECIMANLIFRRYVKGYIVKRTTTAVKVHPKDPFPALPEVFQKKTL